MLEQYKKRPVGGYEWCTEVTVSDFFATHADSAFGYSDAVDFAHPAEVHDFLTMIFFELRKK